MALDDILAAIEEETESRLVVIRQESAERQAEVRLRAEARAAAEKAHLAASRDAELDRARAQRLALAQTSADRTLRAARERVFAAAVERTRDRLDAVRDVARYPDVLRAMLDEAKRALPTATRCLVDPRDVELVARLAPDLEVCGTGSGWAGVVLEDDAGRRVDNALHTRLTVALPELRELVARTLPALWGSS